MEPNNTIDLLLIHAPAYFDFRKESKVYFPYLSTSGDVPITPLYEYMPVGFKSLKKHLQSKGYSVEILNLCSLLLRYPETNLQLLFSHIDAKIIGIDLHWMVHVQGSLEVASLLRKEKPDSKIIFGGISSSYYAEELIQYNCIDMVMRGYDTHEPMNILLSDFDAKKDLSHVPNLIWKDSNNQVNINKMSHLPVDLQNGVDWKDTPDNTNDGSFKINEVLTTQSAGCIHHCKWCGGSRKAFSRIYNSKHTCALKQTTDIDNEFDSLKLLPGIENYHMYNCGTYNEPTYRLEYLLDKIEACNLKSINYEQFNLTPDKIMQKMAKANSKTVITLSPESHDLEISKLAGRGTYSMSDMEKWIDKALNYGIYQVDIWFFVGMPKQDKKSVFDTVEYCKKLLSKYKGENIVPLICPMMPFLDPASTFFENPDQHGYKVFARTVEDHRTNMLNSSIINRINYETKWLTRENIVMYGLDAINELLEFKAELGVLPPSIVQNVTAKINDAKEFIKVVHQIDNIKDNNSRSLELNKIEQEILTRNQEIFFSGVSNQAIPINRKIGGRWIDEIPKQLYSMLEQETVLL